MGTTHDDVSTGMDMAEMAVNSARHKKWSGVNGIRNLNEAQKNAAASHNDYMNSMKNMYRPAADKGD